MSSIKFINVSKNFGNTKVLDRVSFDVSEGELISLVGPSGSGKTTILRIIAGLINDSEGSILIDNVDTKSMKSSERGAVIVYQDYALFPHMTVEENISYGLKVRKVSKSIQKKKAMDLISMLHMDGYEKRYPRELSGGQKQRVAIARALAIEPKVLLLDEPFSSLDANLRDSMKILIKDLQRKLNITTIMVTHDLEEALTVSDRIAVLLEGQVKQLDSPQGIYERPANKMIAQFIGKSAKVDGFLENGILKTPFGELKTSSDYFGPVDIMFRQEAARIKKNDKKGLKGKIIDKTYTGKSMIYKIETASSALDVEGNMSYDFQIGDSVSVDVDLKKLMVYRKDTGGII
ncbi:MAG: ABC transporter ATP-binding protein [Firmicutes bacterium]|jgi:ABC-type Fe3+/spermidine/putrescine transport system ATPase subunit|nr:ABC transporter ATP-binding protein [Bacillota bacterium]